MASAQLHSLTYTPTHALVHAHSILHSMLYCTVPLSMLACCCSATFTGMAECSKLLLSCTSHTCILHIILLNRWSRNGSFLCVINDGIHCLVSSSLDEMEHNAFCSCKLHKYMNNIVDCSVFETGQMMCENVY